MIQNQIDELIKSAMLNKQTSALRAYRAVKTAFMEYKQLKMQSLLMKLQRLILFAK